MSARRLLCCVLSLVFMSLTGACANTGGTIAPIYMQQGDRASISPMQMTRYRCQGGTLVCQAMTSRFMPRDCICR